jgi:hypothetical protein
METTETTETTEKTEKTEKTMRIDRLRGDCVNGDCVNDIDGSGGHRENVNAHSVEAGCGTERDKLRGRVDHASAGRGDGTALHRDTAVNGRAMDRILAERERVLAFSSPLRSAPRTEAR